MKKIFILILVSLIVSCKTESKIDTILLDWQPYKIGDKLVFKSTKNESDTIFVKEIESYTNTTRNNHFVLPYYHTTVFISGEISLTKPFISSIGNRVTRDYVGLLKFSFEEDNDYLTLNLEKRRDTLSHVPVAIHIKELTSMFKNKSEDESVEIDIKSFRNYDTYLSYDLKTFFWSKKFGYTKYEYKSGDSWILTEFIRDGKNILEEQ